MGTIEREGGADDDRTLFARIAPLTLDAEKLRCARFVDDLRDLNVTPHIA